MSATRSSIYLRDGTTQELCAAQLVDMIEEKHLADFEQHWKASADPSDEVEHGHWDWRLKMTAYGGHLGCQSFAVECDDMTQGLMIVGTTETCRLPNQKNSHLVYIKYLSSAPWNRSHPLVAPKYRGVGKVLIAAAIALSIDEGNEGRVGLHSLLRAESYYRDQCKMIELGPDPSCSGLNYFEITADLAIEFMANGGHRNET